MKMIWKKRICSAILLLVAVSLMTIGGCKTLDWLFDPNNANVVSGVAGAAGGAATGAGLPWGYVIITVGSIFSAIATAYNNYRNKVKAATKYEAIEITTAAVVNAIEDVANVPTTEGTIGDIVKAQVQKKLEDKDWFKIGKALIAGLKGN